MSFLYFAPNTFPMIQSLELYQNYHTNIPHMLSSFSSPYIQMMQWNQTYFPQNYVSNDQKIGINQLSTTESYSQSEVIVELEKKQKNFKKKEKKTAQKQISSAKKNSESNIINQFYSFFGSRQKSQRIAIKAIQATSLSSEFEQKILTLFYNTIRAINAKRGRKYVNRAMMLNYFTSDMLMENLPEIKQKLQKVDYISLEELCQIFRRCCQAFLKIVSIPAILTSKRITGISKEQHFKKRRKILKAITGY